jgi:hypothetical protein
MKSQCSPQSFVSRSSNYYADDWGQVSLQWSKKSYLRILTSQVYFWTTRNQRGIESVSSLFMWRKQIYWAFTRPRSEDRIDCLSWQGVTLSTELLLAASSRKWVILPKSKSRYVEKLCSKSHSVGKHVECIFMSLDQRPLFISRKKI